MIEESELFAGRFWRQFDKECRREYPADAESAYERTSLLVLFLWQWQARLTNLALPIGLDDHPEKIQRWWSASIGSIHHILGTERPELWIEPKADWRFLRTAFAVFSQLLGHDPISVAYAYDYRFLRIAEQETGIHRRLSHFSASLVNAVSDPGSNFLDAFSATGEVFATGGNERWRRIDDDASRHYIYQVGGFELEVRMRLALHEKDPTSYRRVAADEYLQLSRTVLRVDPPARRSMPTPRQDLLFDQSNSAAGLFLAIQSHFNVQKAVIVVSGAERSGSTRASKELREFLLNEERLLAVIDLPRPTGVRVDKSAWIVGASPSLGRGGVLMIDLTGLGAATSHQDFGVFAEFAGRLTRCFMGERISARWATSSREDAAAQVRHVFDREFDSGYRDVKGLCRSVEYEELIQNDVALIASRFVRPADRSAWLSGIDGSPLFDLLFHERRTAKTIYLIGNNGQGKSLLLREIAMAAGELQRKAVGISCSAFDRFPLPAERQQGFEHFVYEGARTSDQAANHRKITTDVCRKFLSIHRSDKRLSAFLEVLRLLEFEAKRFVMPLGASSNNSLSGNVLERTVELSNDAAQNRVTTQDLSTLNRPGIRGGCLV